MPAVLRLKRKIEKIDKLIGFTEIQIFFNMLKLCKHMSKTNIEPSLIEILSSHELANLELLVQQGWKSYFNVDCLARASFKRVSDGFLTFKVFFGMSKVTLVNLFTYSYESWKVYFRRKFLETTTNLWLFSISSCVNILTKLISLS